MGRCSTARPTSSSQYWSYPKTASEMGWNGAERRRLVAMKQHKANLAINKLALCASSLRPPLNLGSKLMLMYLSQREVVKIHRQGDREKEERYRKIVGLSMLPMRNRDIGVSRLVTHTSPTQTIMASGQAPLGPRRCTIVFAFFPPV